MLTSHKSLGLILAVLSVMCVSCNPECPPALHDNDQNCNLVLDFDIPEFKSTGSSEEDRVSIITVFIFDSAGQLVKSCTLSGGVRKHELVLDEGYYAYRIVTGCSPGGVNSLNDYNNLLIDFYVNIYRHNNPGFAMTAEGSVSIRKGNNNVTVRLKRLCGKISVKSITMGQDIPGIRELRPTRMYIHNVPTCVHIDGRSCGTGRGVFNWWDGSIMHFTTDESIFRCTTSDLDGTLTSGRSIYPSGSLYCLPTAIPQNNGDMWTDSYLVFEMEAVDNMGKSRTQYYRKPVFLKSNTHLSCTVTITREGSGTPDTDSPEEALDIIIETEPWMEENSQGHSDLISGPMSYLLQEPSQGRDGSIYFENLYGEPRVSSSNPEVLDAIGAGRNWIIFNTGAGSARLEIFDGYNTGFTKYMYFK